VLLVGGRRLANEQRALISGEPSDDMHVRREREQRDARMGLYGEAQTGICAVHAMLLTNALIQMGYPSSGSLEAANVLFSNVIQVMIPLVLARVSELISAQIRTALRLQAVTGPREMPGGRSDAEPDINRLCLCALLALLGIGALFVLVAVWR
jgi:hypothetical protein